MASPIDFQAGLTIGTVESVAPDSIEVALLPDSPHGTALNARLPTRFPRLNGILSIPSETGAVLALISWVGVDRDRGATNNASDLVEVAQARRRIRLLPLGTAVMTSAGVEIQRGVLLFPTVGDPVLLPTADQLAALTRQRRVGSISLGRAPLAAGAEVHVDVDELLGRHLAVLGNTGSGKSCTVASIIRSAVTAAVDGDGKSAARVVILDTNGEYADAFEDLPVTTRRLAVEAAAPEERLRIPGWMWNAREWVAFTAARPGAQAPYIRRALAHLRGSSGITEPVARQAATTLRTLHTSVRMKFMRGPATTYGDRMDDGRLVVMVIENCDELIAAAPPELGAAIDAVRAQADALRSSRLQGKHWDSLTSGEWDALAGHLEACFVHFDATPGRPVHEDDPLPFELSMVIPMIELMAFEDATGGASAWVAPLVFRLDNLLADRRVMSVADSSPEITGIQDWLEIILGAAGEGRVTVLDLSLVPTKMLHLVVAVLGRVLFEAHERFRKLHDRTLPTVIVAEEAHMFLSRRVRYDDDGPESVADLCRDAFERIAREGRKFGLSLVVASQRPSELSETVLSQCNSFLVHRIVNDADQALVRRLVPDSLGGLLTELPSLPSRAAVLMGAAVSIPTLVEIHELEAVRRPKSADPEFFDSWSGVLPGNTGWEGVAADWSVYPVGDATAVPDTPVEEEPF